MNWRLLFAMVVLVSVPLGSAVGAYVVPEQYDYLRMVASAYGYVSGADKTNPLGGYLHGLQPGGEFKFEVYSDAQAALDGNKVSGSYLGDFVTFCAETEEDINWGLVYYFGGLAGSQAPFADWIYFGYLTDDESGNIVPDHESGTSNELNTNAEGADVQDALWHALGQGRPGTWSDDVWASWQAAYATDSGNPSSAWNLRAIDPKIAVLTYVVGVDGSGEPVFGKTPEAQDQFVYISRVGVLVPEPASLLIWSLLGLGSTGLAVWSRRRRGGLTEVGAPRWSRENREAIRSLIERGRRA